MVKQMFFFFFFFFLQFITTAQVHCELAQEEERDLALGLMPLHEVSLSQFLVNGLELEKHSKSAVQVRHALASRFTLP